MTQKTLDGAINAVCDFWIEKMQKPMNQNNGDNSGNGGIAFLLMNMLSATSQESITPKKIEMFRIKLTEIIKRDFRNIFYVCDVDYNPSNNLCEALDYAEIPYSVMPCKTHTTILADLSVRGKYQYGGNFINLY